MQNPWKRLSLRAGQVPGMQVVTGAYKYLVHASLGIDTLKQASRHLRVCRQAPPLHTKPTLPPHSSTTALQTLPLQPPPCRHTPPPHLLPALHQRYSTPLLLPLRTSAIPHIPSHLRPHSSPYHTHSLPHTPCSHILPLQTPTASPTAPTHSPLHRTKEGVREIAMENTAAEERNHKRAREQDSTLSPPAKKVHHKKSPIEESCDDVKTPTQSPSWHHIQPDSQQYTQPHSDPHSQSQSLHSFPINQIPYQHISQPSSQPHIQPHSPTTHIQLYPEPQECRYKDRDTKKELASGRSEGELDTGRLQEKGTALETGEEDMELITGGTSGEKSREMSSLGLLSEGKAEFTKERTDEEAFEEEVKGEGCLFGGEASEESSPLGVMGMNVLLDGKKDEEITLKEEGSKRETEEKETRNKETIYMEADAELTIKEEKGLREIEKMHKNSEILTATSNTALPANTALQEEEELRDIKTKPGDVEINSDIQTVTSKPALPTNTALERKEEEQRGKNEIEPEDSPTHHITSLSTPDTNTSPRKQDTHRERNNTEPTKHKAKLESQITNKTPQTPRNLSKRTQSLTELATVTKHRLGSMDSLNSTAGSSQHTRTSSIDSAKEQHSRKKKRSSQSKKLNTSGEKNLRPNYFVGIQISNPAIHHGLLKVQEDLIESDEALVRTLVDVATSHLTLLVAHLDTEDSIACASAALEESANRMRDGLSATPITLTFSGVSNFNNQVVFAQVVEDEQHGRLLDVAECVRQVFSQRGVCMPDTRDLHPHLTIAKLSKAPRTKGKHSVPRKIDPSFYSHHTSLHFGSQTVASLQLLSMNKGKDPRRYYHCDKEVCFDIKVKEEKDHSGCCFPRRPALPPSFYRNYSTITTTTTSQPEDPGDTQEPSHSPWFVPFTTVTALVAGALFLGFALARIRGNQ